MYVYKKSYVITIHLLVIFPLLSVTLIATNSSDILYDVSPFIRVYKNGTIERLLGTKTVPPSLIDPKTKVHSKDININPKFNISARLYLPKNANPTHKLPLLIYFHGGAFFTESAFSPTYYNHMNSLVSKAKVVAVSVNYRLAPENPLPIGYQDSWRALKWIFSHCSKSGNNGPEPWLKNYVDFGRVYLGGDSAGANIAHNMAIRVGLDKTGHGVVLNGIFLNCPHFWGKKLIGNEIGDPRKGLIESIWVHAYPNSTGFDDPLSNPSMDPNLWKLGCKRVLIYVAEKDVLRDRGWYYGKSLRRSKWDGVVKVVEVKGEDHVFNLRIPDSENAKRMLKHLALFLNDQEYAASATYHNHLNSVVAQANVVAVSVNFRLAPEYLLPIGYQDSWQALNWVFSHSNGNGTEPWLNNYVDFGRVNLGGDSSGGNIAHNMAMWAGLDKTGRVVIDGLFLNCPHFWGSRPIGNENSDIGVKNLMQNIWIYAYPNSTGLDDPLLNPALDPNLYKLGCKRVLVYVGGVDILRARGWLYKQALRKSKWNGVVKCIQAQGQIHDFGMSFPPTPEAARLIRRFASFLNQGDV